MNEHRELPVRCETGRKQKRKYLALALLLFAVFLGGGIWGVAAFGQRPPTFTPPPFEPQAVAGEPTPPPALGYSVLQGDEGFSVGLCGVLTPEGTRLPLYLTNLATNTLWFKLVLTDAAQGTLLGETGVLRPGEYVETLTLNKQVSNTQVTLKIIGYEPNTYVSRGVITLSLALGAP